MTHSGIANHCYKTTHEKKTLEINQDNLTKVNIQFNFSLLGHFILNWYQERMSSLSLVGTLQWRIQRRGPGAPGSPLIFRPNWGPKSRKKSFWDRAPPLISVSGWPAPLPLPFIWSSGSATALLFFCQSCPCSVVIHFRYCYKKNLSVLLSNRLQIQWINAPIISWIQWSF